MASTRTGQPLCAKWAKHGTLSRAAKTSGFSWRIAWRGRRGRGSRYGRALRPSPRTDPYVQHYRIRLLLRVFGAEARVRIRMQDPGLGYPEIGELPKAYPWQARPLAAPPQGVPPMAQDLSAKRIESGPVAGNGVVVEIPLHRSMQPCALLGDRLMPLSQQRLLHRLQFGAKPLRHRLPP